jgi:TonB family protein
MRVLRIIPVALLLMAGTCSAQSSPALCPRHIESPVYPPIAHTAHVTGTVVLRVSIGADGSLIEAALAPESKPNRILDAAAINNVRHWTFVKPPTGPYVETITYDYEFDESLPAEGGKDNYPVITRVSFDLPDHVHVRTNLPMINP